MSRRRTAIAEAEAPPQINVVSMIDVTFCILTFFIMSTLTMTRLETLSVNLPKAKNAQPQLISKASLTINDQGKIFLDRKQIAADQLVPAIKKLKKPDQALTLVLNADRAINYGNAVEVLDQVRLVPDVRVVLATKKVAPDTAPSSQPSF